VGRSGVREGPHGVRLGRAVEDKSRARAVRVLDLLLEADQTRHHVELVDGDDDWDVAFGGLGPVAGSVGCLAEEQFA
jgi:hypothetical protein